MDRSMTALACSSACLSLCASPIRNILGLPTITCQRHRSGVVPCVIVNVMPRYLNSIQMIGWERKASMSDEFTIPEEPSRGMPGSLAVSMASLTVLLATLMPSTIFAAVEYRRRFGTQRKTSRTRMIFHRAVGRTDRRVTPATSQSVFRNTNVRFEPLCCDGTFCAMRNQLLIVLRPNHAGFSLESITVASCYTLLVLWL